MTTHTKITVAVVIALIALLAGFAYYARTNPAADRAAALETVEQFGLQLQKVSLLDANASTTMQELYGPYVSAELLEQWKADPENAPGRLTSSPWPDQIVISTTTSQGAGYVMSGAIALRTSDPENNGLAGIIPVIIQVIPQDGKWIIVGFQEQATTTTP